MVHGFLFAYLPSKNSENRSLTLKPSLLVNPPQPAKGIIFSKGKSCTDSMIYRSFGFISIKSSLKKLCKQQHTIIIRSTVFGLTLIGVKNSKNRTQYVECIFSYPSGFTQMVVEVSFVFFCHCLFLTVWFQHVFANSECFIPHNNVRKYYVGIKYFGEGKITVPLSITRPKLDFLKIPASPSFP